MIQPCSENRVDQCDPDQIPRNIERESEGRHRKRRGKIPQDKQKNPKSNRISKKPDADDHRLTDETVYVVGDALVRVVRSVPGEAHAVVRARRKPAAHVKIRHRPAPADLQDLIDVAFVDDDDDGGRGQKAEQLQGGFETFDVLLLQSRVKIIVPAVEQLGHVRVADLKRDDHRQQAQRDIALAAAVSSETPKLELAGFTRHEIRVRQPPDIFKCGEEIGHAFVSVGRRGARRK